MIREPAIKAAEQLLREHRRLGAAERKAEHRAWSKVHRASGTNPNRQRERSRFFPGCAAAMADQWGDLDHLSPVQRNLFGEAA